MRVIAGSAKGRVLRPPRTSATRPITDRAKESLFAILAPRIPGGRFLDLFAGTGSVGIEALSRGAAAATFVERSGPALAGIRHNLEVTGLAARAEVIGRVAEVPGGRSTLPLALPAITLTGSSSRAPARTGPQSWPP